MAKVSAGWMDTFASLPADKVAADAVIGGVGGMGVNYAANSASGDSGGYLGSAVGGAAVGAVARGGLKKLGANRSERMANEAAEAAAARAERDAIRSANGKDMATGVIDKSVSMFGKIRDAVTGPLRRDLDATRSSATTTKDFFDGLPGGAAWGKSMKDANVGGQTYDAGNAASRGMRDVGGVSGPGAAPGLTSAPSARIGNSYEPPPLITPNVSGGAAIPMGNQTGMPTINAGYTPPQDNSFRGKMMRSASTLNEYQQGVDTSSALNDLGSLYGASSKSPMDNSFRANMMRSASTLNGYQRNVDTSSALNNLGSAYN